MSAMMAACAADDSHDMQVENGDAVVFMVSTPNGVTRSFTYENKWTFGDKMAISEGPKVCQYEPDLTEGSSSASGEQVTLKPSSHESTSDFFSWSPLVTSRTFCGWYPYSDTPPSSVAGATDQRSDTYYVDEANRGSMTKDQFDQLDLLYAPDITVGYKEQVNLEFFHQMCRIVVTVNSLATKGAKPVTAITFGKNNVAAGGILTPGYTGASRAITASWSCTKDQSVQMRLNKSNPLDAQYTYECVVPPQSLTRDQVVFQITTTANNTTTTTNYIPQNLYQDAPDFKPGYQYNFMLTLSRAGMVNISTVQVSDWATSNVTGLTATVPDAGY